MQGVRWAIASLLSRVRYDRCLRSVLPFFGIAFAINLVFAALG